MPARPQDDDDWIGTPPEGRVTRDRADPDYWNQAFPIKTISFGLLGLLAIAVVLLAVL